MKRFLVILWCAFCAIGSVCLRAQSYNEIVEKAMDFVKKDSLVQADSLFRKALKIDPNNARNGLLCSNLGTVQKRLGKRDVVVESYTMALNILP